MLKIVQAQPREQERHIRELFGGFLQWAAPIIEREFGIRDDAQARLERWMETLPEISPPEGRLLLAEYAGNFAGCVALRKIRPGVSEVKHMYVRPAYRRKGVGRALVAGLVDEARQIGYAKIVLDSASFMKEAHALYRSLGFQDIEAYAESEIPEGWRMHWIFMELALEVTS